jgi:predicted NAD/FAD-dependent oxidoreductase
VARDASKPRRPEAETWILHGAPDWSREHLEDPADLVAERLLDAFAAATGSVRPSPDHLNAHRWRFALPMEPLPEPCLVDRDHGLAACGDWCGGPRVEGAFLSGRAAADELLQPLSESGRPDR